MNDNDISVGFSERKNNENEEMASTRDNVSMNECKDKDGSGDSIDENLSRVLDIPVNMTIELGRTSMIINDLLNVNQGSVIMLEGEVGEPLNILINGYLIARGEAVVVSDKLGVRITDIITPSERLHQVSR